MLNAGAYRWIAMFFICLGISGLPFLVASFESASAQEQEDKVSYEETVVEDAGAGVDADKAGADASKTTKEGASFKSIGVLPFDNETRIFRASQMATKIFADRLNRKFPKADFKVLELDEEDYAGGPLLLKEAQRIGKKYGVDAILQGYLIGFKITGGTWPSKAMLYPEVQVVLRLKLVDTKEGIIVKRYTYASKKPKIYPASIRSEKELFGRVMRDIVDELAKQMKKDGIFYDPKGHGDNAVKAGANHR